MNGELLHDVVLWRKCNGGFINNIVVIKLSQGRFNEINYLKVLSINEWSMLRFT